MSRHYVCDRCEMKGPRSLFSEGQACPVIGCHGRMVPPLDLRRFMETIHASAEVRAGSVIRARIWHRLDRVLALWDKRRRSLRAQAYRARAATPVRLFASTLADALELCGRELAVALNEDGRGLRLPPARYYQAPEELEASSLAAALAREAALERAIETILSATSAEEVAEGKRELARVRAARERGEAA